MTVLRIKRWCIGLSMLFSSFLYATTTDPESVQPTGFLPAESLHANWVFSGLVNNENGEQYAWVFQMQRDGKIFHAVAALFDAQTKALIVRDDATATIEDTEHPNWHVGHSFLHFNAINASWIFGLKTPNKQGFNFKVDMLNQPERTPITQDLREGVDVIVSQTGQLNGHVWVDANSRAQFVTAKNAWFRQIWLTHTQSQPHQLNGVLCNFDNGSGFYSMNMYEPDAVRGALAEWFDAQGMPAMMSQFIHVEEEQNGSWHIDIPSPNLHLTLSDAIGQSSIVAGFINQKEQQGFCVLNKDLMTDRVV